MLKLGEPVDPKLLDSLDNCLVTPVPHFANARIIYLWNHNMYCRLEPRALLINGGSTIQQHDALINDCTEFCSQIYGNVFKNPVIINIMGSGVVENFPRSKKALKAFLNRTGAEYEEECDVNITLRKSHTGFPATVMFSRLLNGKFTFNGLKDIAALDKLASCIDSLFV